MRTLSMIHIDDIARAIWRDTYRHDTLLEWREIKRGTMHYKRVMAAAETVRYLFTKKPSELPSAGE